MTTFDARPLLDPVDPAAVARFAREQRAAHPTSGAQIAAWVIAGVAFAVLVLPVGFIMLLGLGSVIGGAVGVAIAAAFGLVLTAVLVTGAAILIRRAALARDAARYRLAGFAAANAMTYIENVPEPPLPGMIFSTGTGRRSTDVVRGQEPRFVEFGNYQYTTSSGKNSQTHRWGYVAVKLDVPLPNIVLDALGDNTLGSGVGFAFRPDQRLSLEGDFDLYFALYCPEGYEVDALYLFTPDIMARFIDNLAQLDVEIVDDWLFLYTRRPVSTLDPATWAWLFGAVGAVLTKLDQWARWRDDRLRLGAAPLPHTSAPAASPSPVGIPPAPGPLPFASPSTLLTPPPPGVAPPGRRLRRRSPWLIVVIALVAVLGITLLPFALGIVAFLVSG
ncbi:hypothetical protein [Streptomyces sp. AC495_CC817]|uniref:hypothetical protein n=1 Tax=Streptomyces sp. AC495_CC817 TaxID=2823900 RepID=UPI001C26BA82|nr:hypothetical protein [Streptomyces sp. AC495_CC817]